ncbi:hypothetical protein WQ54_17395 [Bacillus sp. SA1-12]|uniref:hypothetical protein n=1 Tax=Bacillus sp. SA1-12 TaxID=1455638 RepID=UPI000626FDBA|nr:hypothetical protein [Bacillus sp. SA1-12]KKI88435.1 hypothetical protein WQ54_31420 [Bacillus sp. SA1-12]KKI90995.1 hypothetical protein WQ54_17395 [Bacillus sp. SA1-12]
MKKVKELKAYAIEDDFKFHIVQVVISHSKEVAVYWLRDVAGYTNEEMTKFKVWEFPLDKKFFVRDFGETSARELIKEITQSETFHSFPVVVFWKEAKNEYFENWHSHFEIEEPTD